MIFCYNLSKQNPWQDYAKAVKWYRKAAEQGDDGAQFQLGLIYEIGEGVPKDYSEAAKWYRKAIIRGAPWAQERLEALEQDKKK